MKTQHTPGPWKAVELDEHTVAIKLDRNYTHECIHIADARVMSGNLGQEVPIAVANAHLIAAAPELLDSLIECLEGVEELNGEYQEGWDLVIEKAKRAINRAKGL